jgi:hypothetical protein
MALLIGQGEKKFTREEHLLSSDYNQILFFYPAFLGNNFFENTKFHKSIGSKIESV